MVRTCIGISLLTLAGLLVGCGGEPQPTEEQKAPDYGQKSADQMKNMIGSPGAGGAMKK